MSDPVTPPMPLVAPVSTTVWPVVMVGIQDTDQREAPGHVACRGLPAPTGRTPRRTSLTSVVEELARRVDDVS
jgi:hypothetical protein